METSDNPMTPHKFSRCIYGGAKSCLSSFWCKKNNYSIRHCAFCNHGFVSNEVSPRDLADYYGSSSKYSDGFDVDSKRQDFPGSRSDAARYLSLIESALDRPRDKINFLEVGAGWAYASRIASANKWIVDAIEYSPYCASSLREALPSDSLVYEGSFESFCELRSQGSSYGRHTSGISGAPRCYDAILMSQVLEHAINPRLWLSSAYKMLSEGGILVIAVPQYKGIYRFLGSSDPFIIPPEHLSFFTRQSLGSLAIQNGFEILNVTGYSRIPFYSILRRLKIRPLAVLIYRVLQAVQFLFDRIDVSGVQIQVPKKIIGYPYENLRRTPVHRQRSKPQVRRLPHPPPRLLPGPPAEACADLALVHPLLPPRVCALRAPGESDHRGGWPGRRSAAFS
jgi:hypothetical protein